MILKKNLNVALFLLLGLSCGLPYSLIGSTLTLFLKEAGVSLDEIGTFALVLLPYSLKFLWAPFIDNIHIPFLSKIGHKKSWGILAELGLVCFIFLMSFSLQMESTHLQVSSVFFFSIVIAFFAASQDIVVDSLRIDTLSVEKQGEGAAFYQLGYRLGLFISGAVVIMLSKYISWSDLYRIVALLCVSGILAMLLLKEEQQKKEPVTFAQIFKLPFIDFVHSHRDWWVILLFVLLYKLSNTFLGRMAYPFYYDIGFTKEQIALISGTLGVWVTVFGAFLGGLIAAKYNLLKSLYSLGIVEIGTSIAFMELALLGNNQFAFILTILFDNIVGGMGGTILIAYLSSLCSKRYSASQYSLLMSLIAVVMSVVASRSGFAAQYLGWPSFFLLTAVLMLPSLFLLKFMITKKRD